MMRWDADPLYVDEEPRPPADERVDILEGAELLIWLWLLVTPIVVAALVAVLMALGLGRLVRR